MNNDTLETNGSNDPARTLILRYIARELDASEVIELQTLLKHDLALQKEMAELTLQAIHLAELSAEAASANVVQLDARVSQRRTRSMRRRSIQSMHWLPLAGAAALIFALIGFIATSSKNTEKVAGNKDTTPERKVDVGAEQARFAQAEIERLRAAERVAELSRQHAQLEATKVEVSAQNTANTPSVPSEEQRRRLEILNALNEQRKLAEAELQTANERRAEAERALAEAQAIPKPQPTEQSKTVVQSQPAPSNQNKPQDLARVVFLSARPVTLVRSGVRSALLANQTIQAADRIETSAAEGHQAPAVALALFNGATIELADGTQFEFKDAKTVLLTRGLLYADVEKDTSAAGAVAGNYKLTIQTPSATVGITGTRFDLSADPQQTRVQMEEGSVAFFNAKGTRNVAALQSSTCRSGSAPDAPKSVALASIWRGRKASLETANIEVVSLTLINCENSQPIEGFSPVAQNATIDLAKLPTRKINFQIATRPETVGSLKIEIDGVVKKEMENAAPYSVFGDQYKGPFLPWVKPATGSHRITVTPYSEKDHKGSPGKSFTLEFQIVDGK